MFSGCSVFACAICNTLMCLADCWRVVAAGFVSDARKCFYQQLISKAGSWPSVGQLHACSKRFCGSGWLADREISLQRRSSAH